MEKEWSGKLDLLMTGKGRETERTRARNELRESIIGIAPIFSEKAFFMKRRVHVGGLLRGADFLAAEVRRYRLAGAFHPPLQNYMQMIFEREFRTSLTEAELEMQE